MEMPVQLAKLMMPTVVALEELSKMLTMMAFVMLMMFVQTSTTT